MAAGIVATVALPVLAMLAGAGSMRSDASDRELATRIARESAAALVPLSPGDGRGFFFLGEDRILVSETGETLLFAAFDAEGGYLGRIAEASFREGGDLGGRARHLLRLRLSRTGSLPFLDLELSVEHPAAAAWALRSREPFLARLALP